MKLYNLKEKNEKVNFSQAITLGLGKKQGLFFPLNLPKIKKEKLEELLEMDFITRSSNILSFFIGDEINDNELHSRIQAAFLFSPPKLVEITKNIACFELFHGPTLAFKDFGARFMAQMLSYLNQNGNNKLITI
jgi:threonine synthase